MMIRLSPAPRASDIFHDGSWGFAALHPRAGPPAEQLGWGARLYALARFRGLGVTVPVAVVAARGLVHRGVGFRRRRSFAGRVRCG